MTNMHQNPAATSGDIDAAREAAIENDRAYSRARLKRELRMRPRDDAEPKTVVRNAFGVACPIYRVVDCVPMRTPTENTRPPTERQLAARRRFALNSYLKSRRGTAGQRALDCLESEAVYLDTETTGLGGDDQVIEVAVVDRQGQPLLDEYVKPTVPVSEGALQVHGIGDSVLRNAAGWIAIADAVQAIAQERPVVIFNADFDTRLLDQTARAYGRPPLHYQSVICAMQTAAQYYGSTNRYGSISLADAVATADVPQPYPAHSARGDAAATAALIRAIAHGHQRRLDQER